MFEFGVQLIVAGSLVGLVLLYLVGITYYLSKMLQFPPHYMHRTPVEGLAKRGSIVDPIWGEHVNDPKTDFGLDFKEVVFPSAMNQPAPIPTLRGWYIPCKTRITKKRIGFIAVHGGGRDRREFHRFETFINAAGYDMLLFDYRDHGVSDGRGLGMDWGKASYNDILGAAYFAKHCLQWDKVICLGVSNGAVSTLLAAAHDTDFLIDGIIAESPFLSLKEGVSDIISLTMDRFPKWLSYAILVPIVIRLVSTALVFRIGGVGEASACVNAVKGSAPGPSC